jgi:cytochrome c-type biogenesis protein CcmH
MAKPFGALLLAIALSGAQQDGLAREAAPVADDPRLEARMMAVAVELRCLVCQNQTIADSQAELAEDLRREIRTMLVQGRSEQQILDYMTARYGDFVLYRPPLKRSTALLWAGPALLTIGAMASLIVVLRRRQRMDLDMFDADSADDRKDDPDEREDR